MLRVDIRHNINQASDELHRFAGDIREKVIARTINKTARQGKTSAAQEIKAQYGISSRVVSKSISIRTANRNQLQAVVKAVGGPLPMYAFNPKKTAAGVTVKIKGRAVLVPGAFIARMKSGHVGVFARGGYKGNFEASGKTFGRFRFGKKRLRIGELRTFSVPNGFSNEMVQKKVIDRVGKQFPKVLAQEINYMRSKI